MAERFATEKPKEKDLDFVPVKTLDQEMQQLTKQKEELEKEVRGLLKERDKIVSKLEFIPPLKGYELKLDFVAPAKENKEDRVKQLKEEVKMLKEMKGDLNRDIAKLKKELPTEKANKEEVKPKDSDEWVKVKEPDTDFVPIKQK